MVDVIVVLMLLLTLLLLTLLLLTLLLSLLLLPMLIGGIGGVEKGAWQKRFCRFVGEIVEVRAERIRKKIEIETEKIEKKNKKNRKKS